MEPVLEVKGVSKTYGKRQILHDVNLTIQKGQIYGLVGKNGVGKTTLMRVITGLTFQTQGKFSILGMTGEKGLESARTHIGNMIETPSFFPFMSAKSNLEYYCIQRGVADRSIIDDVLQEVGLQDVEKKPFKNYSLGMKQRLGLALALMCKPDLLVLDEPINGLDPQGIVEIRNLLLRLNHEREVTILISSHILSELSSIATQYGFMKDGTVIEEISAKDLNDKCQDCIEIHVSDTVRASLLLEQELQCLDYEALADNKIRIFSHINEPEKISKLMVVNGIDLYGLEVKKTDLENYFLELLGGDAV